MWLPPWLARKVPLGGRASAVALPRCTRTGRGLIRGLNVRTCRDAVRRDWAIADRVHATIPVADARCPAAHAHGPFATATAVQPAATGEPVCGPPVDAWVEPARPAVRHPVRPGCRTRGYRTARAALRIRSVTVPAEQSAQKTSRKTAGLDRCFPARLPQAGLRVAEAEQDPTLADGERGPAKDRCWHMPPRLGCAFVNGYRGPGQPGRNLNPLPPT